MAGAGYKLFSTGDVLSASDVNTYLQQQTVMVFASAAARTTALASVLAEGMVSYLKDTDLVEIYTGAAWVSLDDPNAIQNSLLTAKGSIVAASAASTPAALAVGTANQVLTVDSSTATGLKWATPAAGAVKGCSVKLTVAQATVSNTNYTVLFGGEDFDTDGYHSTSVNTGRITIPTGLGGYYLFTINNRQTTTSAQQNSISLHVNGSALAYGTSNGNFQSVVNTGGIGITTSGSIIYYATAGDYFTCVAYLGGAALSVDNAVFQAIYLGA